MILSIFRWLYGYAEISVSGSFPERFLNLAARNGINLWQLCGSKQEIRSRIRLKDLDTAMQLSSKAQCSLSVNSRHGLPDLLYRYRCRAGIPAGLLTGILIYAWMSGCIWNITINAPSGVNESEIRQQLRELGFREGVRSSDELTSRTENLLRLKDGRISWVNINIFGTTAACELSAGKTAPDTSDKKTVSNLRSTADGTITKISVRKGSAAVRIGEGIRKGQLLVSGITENADGSFRTEKSEGDIYALTSRTVYFELPKNVKYISLSENRLTRCDISIFGIKVPLSLSGSLSGNTLISSDRFRMGISGNDMPITLQKETQTVFSANSAKISSDIAKAMLNKRAGLYKAWIQTDKKCMLVSSDQAFSESKDSYKLTLNIVTEEEISESAPVIFKEEALTDQNQE